jgi:hypothetical protein
MEPYYVEDKVTNLDELTAFKVPPLVIKGDLRGFSAT